MKEGNNEIGRKDSKQNTEKKFRIQLAHPLTLEVPLHGERFQLKNPIGRKKRSGPTLDTQNPHVI